MKPAMFLFRRGGKGKVVGAAKFFAQAHWVNLSAITTNSLKQKSASESPNLRNSVN